MNYETIGKQIGSLVDEKNKQYGDAFNKTGEFLEILYPNGIEVKDYNDVLALVRVFDKIMRIANGNQGNENAWNDLAGYGILMSKPDKVGFYTAEEWELMKSEMSDEEDVYVLNNDYRAEVSE